MGARIVWLLLLPILFLAGGIGLLNAVFICGDDGPADYGDPAAIRFCRALSDREVELFGFSAFIPWAVLVFGCFLWPSPQRLRRFNRLVFVASGVFFVVYFLVATTEQLALWAGVLCVVVLILDRVYESTRDRSGPPEAADR